MDKIESELEEAAMVVSVGVRMLDGLNPIAVERLRTALRAAATAWREKSVISKSAAGLFVDLAFGIRNCSYGYSGAKAVAVRDFADEVSDLVSQCIATNERMSADGVELELRDAARSMLVELRLLHGLDVPATQRLRNALRAVATEWAEAEVISKSAASLFVELGVAIDECSHGYFGKEAEAVKYFADEVAESVRRFLAPQDVLE